MCYNLSYMKKIKIFFIILAVLLLGFVVYMSARTSGNRENAVKGNNGTQQVVGKYDVFVNCIKENGVVFYGAFWCPHCNNNKEMFGNSKNLLPYVECSTEDGQGQVQVCKDEGITGYPTWKFADGTKLPGEITLETLAQKTSCALPQ